MAKSSVGVYISSKAVDIVELDGSMNAPRLLNFIRQDIIATAASAASAEKEAEKVSNQENAALAIKEGLEKLNIKTQPVYTVLPAAEVMVRNFSMPQLPKGEQEQALRFEARKYIPFKIDEIVSDFKLTQPAKGAKATSVFFIAATKESLNFHIETFKSSGIDVLGIDVIPFALIRMLILGKRISVKENTAILYIDTSKESASIYIVEKGMPFLNRDLKINTDDKDALFEKFASELRVSLDYYRRQSSQAEVSKIIICGESLFADLSAYLSDELKIITETLESLAGIVGQDKIQPSAVVACGTALGGLGKSRYSINLSPLAVAIKKKKIINILLVEAVTAVFIVIVAFMATGAGVKGRLNLLNAIKGEGKDLPEYTKGLNSEALDELKNRKTEDLKFLRFLLSDRISWAHKLNRIAQDLPDGVWIDNLSAREEFVKKDSGYPSKLARSISMAGNCFSTDSDKETEYISKFFTSLKEDRRFMASFSSIELGSIDKTKVGDNWVSSFNIVAGEKGLEKEGPRWRRR